MKNLLLFVMTIVLFSLSSNAQSITSSKSDTTKFLVSNVVAIKAPDSDDLNFIAVSVREELIRSKKIMLSNTGDTLFVTLLSQHPKVNNSSFGRDGKYGELSVSIVSKNGKAAATSRGYLSSGDGEKYYQTLQDISKGAAERFLFTK